MAKILGIIPARGGSKSIPRKNIKPFLGKPLIAWTIKALKESGVCDRVIVSTDDKEIAEVARTHGADVPFLRPPELAEDTTPTLPVLQHAVSWLKEKDGYEPDIVVLTQATSPGVQALHIQEGVNLYRSSGADSVISLVRVPSNYSPHWQFNLEEGGKLTITTGTPVKKVIRRRQELPVSYIRNSAFYIFRPSLLFEPDPSFYGDDVRGYMMEDKYNIDIDTPDDWRRGEESLKDILFNNG